MHRLCDRSEDNWNGARETRELIIKLFSLIKLSNCSLLFINFPIMFQLQQSRYNKSYGVARSFFLINMLGMLLLRFLKQYYFLNRGITEGQSRAELLNSSLIKTIT